MSLEAWGDDGDADRPYTQERVDELIAEAIEEAKAHLKNIENKYNDLQCDLDDARNGWEATMVRADELANLLKEARDLLHHTKCLDEDAMQCPACSLESRIDSALL